MNRFPVLVFVCSPSGLSLAGLTASVCSLKNKWRPIFRDLVLGGKTMESQASFC